MADSPAHGVATAAGATGLFALLAALARRWGRSEFVVAGVEVLPAGVDDERQEVRYYVVEVVRPAPKRPSPERGPLGSGGIAGDEPRTA